MLPSMPRIFTSAKCGHAPGYVHARPLYELLSNKTKQSPSSVPPNIPGTAFVRPHPCAYHIMLRVLLLSSLISASYGNHMTTLNDFTLAGYCNRKAGNRQGLIDAGTWDDAKCASFASSTTLAGELSCYDHSLVGCTIRSATATTATTASTCAELMAALSSVCSEVAQDCTSTKAILCNYDMCVQETRITGKTDTWCANNAAAYSTYTQYGSCLDNAAALSAATNSATTCTDLVTSKWAACAAVNTKCWDATSKGDPHMHRVSKRIDRLPA